MVVVASEPERCKEVRNACVSGEACACEAGGERGGECGRLRFVATGGDQTGWVAVLDEGRKGRADLGCAVVALDDGWRVLLNRQSACWGCCGDTCDDDLACDEERDGGGMGGEAGGEGSWRDAGLDAVLTALCSQRGSMSRPGLWKFGLEGVASENAEGGQGALRMGLV